MMTSLLSTSAKGDFEAYLSSDEGERAKIGGCTCTPGSSAPEGGTSGLIGELEK